MPLVGRSKQLIAPAFVVDCLRGYTRGMKKHNGFTLIELMITLAVAAILVTIGIPSFQYILQSNRIATQTNEMITGLNVARSEAVRRNQDVTVEPSNGDWLEGFQLESENEVLREFEEFGAGITIDGAPARITFEGNGHRDLGAGDIEFALQVDGDCMGDMRRIIRISVGGAISTERAECQE